MASVFDMKTKFIAALLFCFLAVPQTVYAKEDVVAVLSSDLQPYQDAFAAFQATLQRPIRVVHLSHENARISGEPKVIMLFGAKAAHFKYPESSALIYGMAPGTQIQPGRRAGPVTEIPMTPRAQTVIQKLRGLQPGLHRLTVVWLSPSNGPYAKELQKAGRSENMDVQIEKLEKSEDLPDRLRALPGRTDALWIPSDPLLVSDENLTLLARFSSSARIPFYSSIPGLTDEGAVASLSVSDGAVGRSAAQLAQKILNGSTPPATLYAETMDVTVNRKAAEGIGLKLESLEMSRP
jgi:hypothetical protein